jgi:hypothetical protein
LLVLCCIRLILNDFSTTWHAAENAEYFKAYAAKEAFKCACGTSRTVPTAWPGTDTALDNDQLQAFAATHLGIGDPELSRHVGAPIEAPNRAAARAPGGARPVTRWVGCRATNLYTASFPGKAGLSRRHDGLRDRIYREAVRAGLLAHREYAPAVMRGLTDEQRKTEGPRCRVRGRAPLRSRGGLSCPGTQCALYTMSVLSGQTFYSTRGSGSPGGGACLSR